DHKVVCICPYLARIGVQQWYVFFPWRREGVVHCVIALRFLIPFQQWKVQNPQRGIRILIAESQAIAHQQTQFVELFACSVGLPSKNEDEISGLSTKSFDPPFEIVRRVKLIN